MTVFECEDRPDDLLCGVYDAWMSRLGHDQVKLGIKGQGNLEMFCEYRQVEHADWKVKKVQDAILQKLSREVYQSVYKTSLSCEPDKADRIYRFLVYAFSVGPGVMSHLQADPVYHIFRICRFVSNEAHFHLEFLRFSQMEPDILYSRIGPKNDVLTLIAPHFADRLPSENWMIYDVNRQRAVLHRGDRGWIVADMDSQQWQQRLNNHSEEDGYRSLWKAFYQSIAIKERTNPTCQRNHLPLRYRAYMTEFLDS